MPRVPPHDPEPAAAVKTHKLVLAALVTGLVILAAGAVFFLQLLNQR
jgi:ATP/ADP translocase